MYTYVKRIQNYFVRYKLGVVLVSFFIFLSGGSLGAATLEDITAYSSVTFTRMQDVAHGLNDFFEIVNRKLEKNVVNINNQDKNLVILEMAFKSFNNSSTALSEPEDVNDDDVEPAITSRPLVYPNPFRQSSTDGAILSYDLSKDFSFEIHIYNMLSQRVFKQTFQEGFFGARKGSNRLKINYESLGGYLLSSGVYFYVFVKDQKVLSRGKMVVKP